jgi:hypothetical protein
MVEGAYLNFQRVNFSTWIKEDEVELNALDVCVRVGFSMHLMDGEGN